VAQPSISRRYSRIPNTDCVLCEACGSASCSSVTSTMRWRWQEVPSSRCEHHESLRLSRCRSHDGRGIALYRRPNICGKAHETYTSVLWRFGPPLGSCALSIRSAGIRSADHGVGRRLAHRSIYVGRVLKGAKPAEPPVQRPQRFSSSSISKRRKYSAS
jgi:hypothetical protein